MKDGKRQKKFDVLRKECCTGATLTHAEIRPHEDDNVNLDRPPSSSSLFVLFTLMINLFLIS